MRFNVQALEFASVVLDAKFAVCLVDSFHLCCTNLMLPMTGIRRPCNPNLLFRHVFSWQEQVFIDC